MQPFSLFYRENQVTATMFDFSPLLSATLAQTPAVVFNQRNSSPMVVSIADKGRFSLVLFHFISQNRSEATVAVSSS